MTKSVPLYEVDGQGTVLASCLVALAAVERGIEARGAETIGMAQRGEGMASHVRIGGEIYSPMIPYKGTGAVIGFEPMEAVRCLPYLKKGEYVVASPVPIRPVTVSLTGSAYTGEEMVEYLKQIADHLIVVDGTSICNRYGSTKILDVALLGTAIASDFIDISLGETEQAILKRVPEKFRDMSVMALKMDAVSEYVQIVPENSSLTPGGWADHLRWAHPSI